MVLVVGGAWDDDEEEPMLDVLVGGVGTSGGAEGQG